MAAVQNRFIAALGPVKMEIVDLITITNGDTFTTLIQNPKFIAISEYATSATTAVTTASVVASTKTVTIVNASMNGTQKAVALVFGF